MKKFGYIVITLLEIALFIGAYVINYFTKRKMGMLRYVLYQNEKWEVAYPITLLKYISVTVIIILAIIIFLIFMKKQRQERKYLLLMNIGMIIIILIYVGFTCFCSVETMRAYYFISPLLGMAVFLQIIKTGVALVLCKENTDAK